MKTVWIFGYGSLFWDPEPHVTGFRKATLHGWHREYCILSTNRRGTQEHPGLALGLIPGGSVTGLLFRLPEHQCDRFKVREGIATKHYLLLNSEVTTLHLTVDRETFHEPFFVVVANPDSKFYVGNWSLEKRAHLAVNASREGRKKGMASTAVEYIINTYESHKEQGIEDPKLKEMYDAVKTILRQEHTSQ